MVLLWWLTPVSSISIHNNDVINNINLQLRGIAVEVFVGLVFFLFAFVGVVLSYVHTGKISRLTKEVAELKRQQACSKKQMAALRTSVAVKSSSPSSPTSSSPVVTGTSEKSDAFNEAPPSAKPESSSTASKPPATPGSKAKTPSSAPSPSASAASPEASVPSFADSLSEFIRANGLLWLGGLILAIGGVFLARYAIEAGLLPPIVRIIAGGTFGVLLIAAAEYLARNKERFNINTPYISASIASGGVVTCYAIVLVAFDFYHFLSPQVAFIALAAVAVAASSLAFRFGSLLAWIGVIGAYAVPVLVSTGSNNVAALLIYTAVISTSAVWLSQAVRQSWLWWLALAAHFGWFGVSLTFASGSDFSALLIFSLFSIYLFVLSDIAGWRLLNTMSAPLTTAQLLMPRKEHLGVLLSVIMLGLSVFLFDSTSHIIISNIALAAVLLGAAYRYSALDSWPFIALAFALYCYLLFPKNLQVDELSLLFSGNYLFVQLATLVALAYSVTMIILTQRPAFMLLLIVSPVALLGVSYALSPNEVTPHLYPVWAGELSLVAIVSVVAIGRSNVSVNRLTYALLANACVTLTLTMLLDAAVLTLALSVQVAAMSFLSKKYEVVLPTWLYKVALVCITSRLTFAPWLSDYTGEQIIGIHWSIVVYPIVLGIFWFARRYNPVSEVKQWLEGAGVHIVALLTTTETSYLLLGEYPSISMGYKASALLAFNWLVLSGVYLYRAKNSSLEKWYNGFAIALACGAWMLHLDISLANNPFLSLQPTGDGVIFNWLLVQWAFPAVVLAALAILNLVPQRFHTACFSLAGALCFLYISGFIRGIYHPNALVFNANVEQSELYTYSLVWLMIASLMIFASQLKQYANMGRAGFILLAIVLFKAFLVDMSNLEGLYRAISFIGLGLSLVGIGWLYQRLHSAPEEER